MPDTPARNGLRPRLLADPVHFLALGGGAGLAPHAPGTAGTLLALALAWLIGPWPLAVKAALVAALAVAGVWLCGESARKLGEHDHPAIVLDEIVAMLAISLAVPPRSAWLVAAFVLFRIFDIVKPWPIRDLDHRLSGGLGIMLDDLMAGVYTVACLFVLYLLVPSA